MSACISKISKTAEISKTLLTGTRTLTKLLIRMFEIPRTALFLYFIYKKGLKMIDSCLSVTSDIFATSEEAVV